MQVACRLAGIILGMLALTACNFDADMGFVEIRTVPVAAPAPTALYLDSEKLEPLRKGSAVLRQLNRIQQKHPRHIASHRRQWPPGRDA